MTVDHYAQWREDWRIRFLSMQPQALVKKLPFLHLEQERLWLHYFSMNCAIRLCDGKIEAPKPFTLYDELNIYTLLWYAKPDAALSGQWISFSQLKDAAPFAAAFQRGILEPIAATFTGHIPQLEQALQQFGGTSLPNGDVSYQIFPFPCIPMQLYFWEGDEDFPAQANLLFDRSATDFIHVESIVTIASQALHHLADAAGLPVATSAL